MSQGPPGESKAMISNQLSTSSVLSKRASRQLLLTLVGSCISDTKVVQNFDSKIFGLFGSLDCKLHKDPLLNLSKLSFSSHQ